MAMLCTAFVGYAEGKSLKLTLQNGAEQTYMLADKPVVTFQGEKVLIASEKLSSEYPRSDVKSFSFADVSTNAVEDTVQDTLYIYDGSNFSSPGNEIAVYNLQGMKVADGRDNISLTSQASGIYIIKVSNQTIKIRK